MATLGIGVRVYVGWTANASRPGLVCQQGVVVNGPYPAGTVVGRRYRLPGRSWKVALDSGARVGAVEKLLTPIDPDTPAIQTEREELIA